MHKMIDEFAEKVGHSTQQIKLMVSQMGIQLIPSGSLFLSNFYQVLYMSNDA